MVTIAGKAILQIEKTDPSDRIYYTTDGTEPSSSSPEYTGGGLELYKHTSVRILEDGGSTPLYKTLPAVWIKLFSDDLSVEIVGDTFSFSYPYRDQYSDLSLEYYRTDGTLFQTLDLKATPLTVSLSDYEKGDYVVMSSTDRVFPSDIRVLPIIEASNPVITYVPSEDRASVIITISSSGGYVYYTFDDSEPSAENGTVYTGPFEAALPLTLKAITILLGVKSEVVTLDLKGFIPEIALEKRAGSTSDYASIYITNYASFSGLNIVYTSDGSVPNESSTPISSDHIDVYANGIYYFWAYQDDYESTVPTPIEISDLKCQSIIASFSY